MSRPEYLPPFFFVVLLFVLCSVYALSLSIRPRPCYQPKAHIVGTTLQKREFWSFIGWSGRDCTGGLVFASTEQRAGGCVNTRKLAPSVSYLNTRPVPPIAYPDNACRTRTRLTYVKDLGKNYWCMNGDVRSFRLLGYRMSEYCQHQTMLEEINF